MINKFILLHQCFLLFYFQIEKFRRIKGLNCSMLNGVCDTVVAKETVRELLAKCERLATKTGRKISSVGTLVSKQPSLLNSEYVLPFQTDYLRVVYVC